MLQRIGFPGWILIVAASAAAAVGCATNETTRYRPSLSSVTVPLGEDGAASTLVSVLGLVPAQGEMPAGIEVRLRLDNHGERALRLEASDLELVKADLTSLGRAELMPAGPVVVAPGKDATVSAVFAVPPELKPNAEALRALNLRIGVSIGGRTYASSVTFDRIERDRAHYYYAAYDYWPYAGFGAPVVIVHHHHMH